MNPWTRDSKKHKITTQKGPPMDCTRHILENIRQTYKNDDKPIDQLYHKMLKAVFRYDTDQKPVAYASRAALDMANKMNVNLAHEDWHSQNHFDPGRKIFHYEHCNPISVLADQVLKSQKPIPEIIDDNVVCWILKSEDKKLNENGYKSGRPGGWKRCYHNCNIEPIQINQ